MALHRLTKIVVGVTDVATAIPFYEEFGLAHLGNGRFATADGGEQLELAEGVRRQLVEIGIGCDDPDDVARVVHELERSGIPHAREGEDVVAHDAGSGVRARVTIAPRYEQLVAEQPATNGPGVTARANAPAPGTSRSGPVQPRKLGHVIIGSTEVEASERLFIDVLGFQVSDTIRDVGKFVRCSTDHHNLMVSKSRARYLHHTSWQVDDLDDVGRGASHMVRQDPTRHVWGLGRHNVGSNFFYYLLDPAGNFVEYYSDLDVITDPLCWNVGDWGPRESAAAWGPKPPRGFFSPEGLPDAVAEVMMKGGG
ncbi:MAG: VOC family protein [Frankiaceae bacterium]|nr:VOC family protein [Frankiaceae bacterium]